MDTPFTRPAAVAGSFYPADPEALKRQVKAYLREVVDPPTQTEEPGTTPPKAIIVPHAGYIYSGPVAASVYAQLRPWHEVIKRVILLGPSHRIPLEGIAASSADNFATPLGKVPLDREAIRQVLTLPQVNELDEAHRLEHSLEVQLPFLQELIDDFTLVPLVFGCGSAEAIAEVLEQIWGGPETLIVVSSDLSHFHNYSQASVMDQQAAQAIKELAPEKLSSDHACGQKAIQALLIAARRHGLQAKQLDLRNSGDTAGGKDRVVGYAAFEFNVL